MGIYKYITSSQPVLLDADLSTGANQTLSAGNNSSVDLGELGSIDIECWGPGMSKPGSVAMVNGTGLVFSTDGSGDPGTPGNDDWDDAGLDCPRVAIALADLVALLPGSPTHSTSEHLRIRFYLSANDTGNAGDRSWFGISSSDYSLRVFAGWRNFTGTTKVQGGNRDTGSAESYIPAITPAATRDVVELMLCGTSLTARWGTYSTGWPTTWPDGPHHCTLGQGANDDYAGGYLIIGLSPNGTTSNTLAIERIEVTYGADDG
ncbi:MAG: hypothetical protein H6739_29455 [Alphaproteobacteria bacterium]|nr:hypothetical protein [Alphaproteobacteria bacterium]